VSVAPPCAAAHAADGGAAQFARIDWSAPWLAQYDEPGRLLQVAALAGEAALLDALGDAAGARTSGRGRPLRFVPQAELPPGVAYETHIADTGACRPATIFTTSSMRSCGSPIHAPRPR
jgi:hypothetical protein